MTIDTGALTDRGTTMTRHLACSDGELQPGTSMTIAGSIRIALFRNETGEYFATADRCSHEEWSLGEDSDLEGNEVVCPLHMARFDIRTGQPLCLPAIEALRTFAVEIEDGNVYVVE